MPELDPFDARLVTAVHAFADRAQTSVDAVAVAARAVGHRRSGPWAVLTRAVPVPIPVLVVPLLLVAFIGWSLSGGGPFPVRIWFGPAATPTAEPTQTPSPTPSPTPTIEPLAPAYVAGTATSTQVAPTATPPGEGNAPPLEGGVLEVVTEMDDPRVTGTGTLSLTADAGSALALGFVSGTFHLDAVSGTWDGACTGSSWEGITRFWNGMSGAHVSCWLQGSGAYAGLTLYLSYRIAGISEPDELVGTILPAEPKLP